MVKSGNTIVQLKSDVLRNMDDREKDALRAKVSTILAAGLETKVEPFPETDRDFTGILGEIRKLGPDKLVEKLVLAGFLDHPFGRDMMRCRECNYYLIRGKWCDLPEISLPVEPDWWCRLWRI
jgi:hypothetical protein